MKTLKLGVAIASLTTIAFTWNGLSPTEPAQADDACYMINSAGKRVSLGSLCQRNTTPPQPNRAFHQARIKRRSGGTPVIDVLLNGRAYEMLVDTGASGSVITATMAQALNLPIVGMGRFTMADGRSVMMPIGQLNSLVIDGAALRNINVAIVPSQAESLLGSDFLDQYDVKIRRDVIEFHPR